MNRKYWQDHEGHPPAALLLLHLEAELEGLDAEAVRNHVSSCEHCRATCEQLELGKGRFDEFRESVILPASAPRGAELQRRLQKERQSRRADGLLTRTRRLLMGNSKRRLVFVMGTASIAVIVGLVVFLGNPHQSVYASQILNDARNASDSLVAQSKVMNQKFLLRRGKVVIERTAHHGKAPAAGAKQGGLDPQLQKSLDLARIRLEDPLSVNDFTEWRSEQSGHSDSVKETSRAFIITVHVNGSEVTEGSLTLSRSELRPIARSVEFRDESPIEITEESYSISDLKSPESATEAAPVNASAPEGANAAAEVRQPSVLDLEKSEIDLREAFHAAGLDISASPVIWTADHTVFYHATPRTDSQRQAIENTASRVALVKRAERAPVESALRDLGELKGPYKTTPPLQSALVQFLGSEGASSSFLDSLGMRTEKVEREASALNELGLRYSPEDVKALPPDLRKRVSALASSLLSTLQHDTADLEKFITPVLGGVSQGVNVNRSSADDDNLPGCLTWQQSAKLALPRLQQLRRDLLLMFTTQESESPANPKPEETLSDAGRIRSFLQAHLISTCELF
jgi:hypothetical protein